MSPPLAPPYCARPTPTQARALDALGIRTVADLFEAVRARHGAASPPPHAPEDAAPGPILYKRHIVKYVLSNKCRGPWIDFDRLCRDKLVRVGGARPDTWVALRPSTLPAAPTTTVNGAAPPTNDKNVPPQPRPRAPSPSAPPPASPPASPPTIASPPSPPPASPAIASPTIASPPAEAPAPIVAEPSSTRATRAAMPWLDNAPDELCCPITLQLLQDPVQTLRGHTYERAAIEAWLARCRDDPMTGERLPFPTLWHDAETERRVVDFVATFTRPPPIPCP